MSPMRHHNVSALLLAVLLLSIPLVLSNPSTALAYTPENPEVKQMVKKAMASLEDATHGQPGGMALVGMAFLKSGAGDLGHPKVQEAIAQARGLARQASREGVGEHCYNEAIACIFLCEASPEEFQPEIRALLGALLNRQQQNGCWGYKPHTYDDTSQTQYGMLTLWTAHRAGVPVPVSSVERAMQWLFRIQAKDGGYPYKPGDPVSLSMSAAGLGSVYVGAHLLGFGVQGSNAKEEGKAPLPPALQLVGAKKKTTDFQTLRPQAINAEMVRRATSAGNAWFDKNFGCENSDPRWTFYYLYALERYKSFMEAVEGKAEDEPAWYNAGVESLKGTQAKDGSWDRGMVGKAADTAFAVLFLVRSTKGTVGATTHLEGTLVSTHGLLEDLANPRTHGEQMVGTVDDFIRLVNDAVDKELDAKALPDTLPLAEDAKKRRSQVEQLRGLARDSNWEVRRVAVATLAGARDLDNVPTLIYALTDPDQGVSNTARDGLRFVSRKLQGYGMPTNASQQQKQAAARKWKQWYLSIRPDAEFVD